MFQERIVVGSGGGRSRVRIRSVALVAAGSLLTCGVAWAAETITYSYDAKGRLIRVERSGNINNGIVTNYAFDDTDNRKLVNVTGSPNSPPP